MAKFTSKGKALSITESDLTTAETKMFKMLVRMGDSKELALWTIEHVERAKSTDTAFYNSAYTA